MKTSVRQLNLLLLAVASLCSATSAWAGRKCGNEPVPQNGPVLQCNAPEVLVICPGGANACVTPVHLEPEVTCQPYQGRYQCTAYPQSATDQITYTWTPSGGLAEGPEKTKAINPVHLIRCEDNASVYHSTLGVTVTLAGISHTVYSTLNCPVPIEM